jgi:hypothetical protein
VFKSRRSPKFHKSCDYFWQEKWDWLSQPALLSFTNGLTYRAVASANVILSAPVSDWRLTRHG